MKITETGNNYKIYCGDSLVLMDEIPENTFDTCITDPPYHLKSITKRFGKKGSAPAQYGKDGAFSRISKGFMGKEWDGGDISFNAETWKKVYRVMKPGGTLLAFGSCYDKETEVLTKRGWKYFKDVTKEDLVATLNPETEEIIYQNPIEIVKYDNCKNLYYFKTNKIDIMVTPNHKMLVKYLGGYKNAKWKLVRADEVKNAIKMKKNGIWKGSEVDYFVLPEITQSNGHKIERISEKKIPMDIWLKFLGLWIAEGSATITKVSTGNSYKTQICHFNNNNLDELENELKKYFNICRYRDSGKFIINNKQLTEYLQPYCYSWSKHIPEEIKQLCPRQLKILLEWYMKGDSDGRRCYTCSKKLVDDLQEIALKIGLSADYTVRKEKIGKIGNRAINQKHTSYSVSINFKQNEPEVYQRKDKKPVVNIVEYNGAVYCVEVPLYNTLYVRRNGKAVWCGNTRTYHRIAVAIEDAGFILKDTIMWVYGQGFPKSYDISKGIDKKYKAERPVIGRAENAEEIMRRARQRPTNNDGLKRPCREDEEWIYNRANITAPATEEAQLWDGWATALKPAYEPIIVAMKPTDGSYVDNALKWGVAGFWIDGARIKGEDIPIQVLEKRNGFGEKKKPEFKTITNKKGRYPSNFIIDNSGEVMNLFPKTGTSRGGRIGNKRSALNMMGTKYEAGDPGYGDSGSAARFFYCAKPTRAEKNAGVEGENTHPTTKPLSLLRYLARLTKTPTGGIVFDPFMGSGTTGVASILEERKFYGIEKEEEYYNFAKQRLYHTENLPIREPVILKSEPSVPIEIIEAAVDKAIKSLKDDDK